MGAVGWPLLCQHETVTCLLAADGQSFNSAMIRGERQHLAELKFREI